MTDQADICVVISAGAEWRAVLPLFDCTQPESSPYGEFFYQPFNTNPVAFMHSGWGKVACAGATQYAIDRWQPRLLINLGTCGGVAGRVAVNNLILAQETIIYDIIEGMSGYQAAIDHYSVQANLGWLGDDLPFQVKRLKLYSADRDMRPEDVAGILRECDASAADWESGAFAWVCARNHTDWLVLRAVTDLVSEGYGEALGHADLWRQRTEAVMATLIDHLPWLIDRYEQTHL